MAIIHAERHRHPASLTTEPPASAARAHQAELSLLLRLIDESYEKKAWHGPNLKGSFRGLAPRDAAWRPQPLPALDCGERRALRLLEVRRQAPAYRRKTRFFFTQG